MTQTLTVAQVRKALRDCIETRWKPAAERATGRLPRNAPDCQLCGLFANGAGDGPICAGCPIREKTGDTACEGTPYWYWDYVSSSGNARKEAQAMLTFLQDLDHHYFGPGSKERVAKMMKEIK